ncbi:MAG: zf-HC2 domain-containing protein [Firmicutes bacterium]|nr:zf-HC2 domain-containing protein [Bacillota bacterium]
MKMTCLEAVKRLVDYVHSDIETPDKDQIAKHLSECNSCCDRFEFEEKLVQVVRSVSQKEKCPASLKTSIMGKIKEAL